MTKIHQLAQLGQSIWLDYIRRAFIDSGELQAWVEQGVRGVTSNPAIFEKAIAGSADYDADLKTLVESGQSDEEIYEALALADIRRAADTFRPVYDESGGQDGYVSLEVRPTLAADTEGTIAEARRLFAALDRPNVMIKVPATPEGIPAIETLIGAGINVNVTLIFSLSHYEAVAEAYIKGLEKRAASGGNLRSVASVASFFVSRVDTAVDQKLAAGGPTDPQGKTGIANAKIAYARFQKIFSGERWEKLAAKGARGQRPLWASTGTKNPIYSDCLYVDNLIGPDTVNTVPLETLDAFLDHGTPAVTLTTGLDAARAHLAQLADLGIDLDAITQKLQDDGVTAFANAFEGLLASIAAKREKLLAGWDHMRINVGAHQVVVDQAIDEMRQQAIMRRIWAHDHTVWQPDPAEITNRLGWLHSAEVMREHLGQIGALTEAVRADGYTHALLLGMGGSSLAPEVFRKTFGVKDGYLDLAVLDSTDPGAVLAYAESLDLARTLFIVATKSGGTAETLSFFKYFYNRVAEQSGADVAGAHFIAITDPGSSLVTLAEKYGFRATFLNDPNIGGRYSALSYFGLVPAALIGVDLVQLLDRALRMACNCESANCPKGGNNYGARLGAVMGELAQAGRDKVTLIASPPIASFGDWVEQLIAESTGKNGKGILPVVGEPVGRPEVYGKDRLFVHLCLDDTYNVAVKALEDAGQPVVWLYLDDQYDLGGQMFLWEMATAVAGYRIGIQPFDQPNVEAAKVIARRMITAYQKEGKLPAQDPLLEADGIAVYGNVAAKTPGDALSAFLDQARPGDYVALQAYVTPDPETDKLLLDLRTRLRDRLRRATTVGYGPRFLHSTGQLHKGDGGNGLFIQFTSDTRPDAAIPDEAGKPESSMTFSTLKLAQALGDHQALLDNQRRVIRFHLGTDVVGGLRKLVAAQPQK